MKDGFGREIEYMRISITDRCNLRCTYCMPHGIRQVPVREVLTYEEILEVCKAAAGLGITKFKITGGEPLVRPGCADLIREMKKLEEVRQVTLTTNGVLLGTYAKELMRSGLDAVNVSLDTLDRETYRRITGFDELDRVRQSIECALDTGIPLKMNCVLQKGVNDGEWRELLQIAKNKKADVRFIEMMPIGYGKQCQAVSGEMLFEKIRNIYPGMEREERKKGNGPAVYYKIPGFLGSVGFISAIHGKFCDSCNRIRLTSTGELKPCLCFGESVHLKPILRNGVAKEQLKAAIAEAIQKKPREHCFEKEGEITERKQMVQIGG